MGAHTRTIRQQIDIRQNNYTTSHPQTYINHVTSPSPLPVWLPTSGCWLVLPVLTTGVVSLHSLQSSPAVWFAKGFNIQKNKDLFMISQRVQYSEKIRPYFFKAFQKYWTMIGQRVQYSEKNKALFMIGQRVQYSEKIRPYLWLAKGFKIQKIRPYFIKALFRQRVQYSDK